MGSREVAVATALSGRAWAVVAFHISTMSTSQAMPPLCLLQANNSFPAALPTAICASHNLQFHSGSDCSSKSQTDQQLWDYNFSKVSIAFGIKTKILNIDYKASETSYLSFQSISSSKSFFCPYCLFCECI